MKDDVKALAATIAYNGPPKLADDWQAFVHGYLEHHHHHWHVRSLQLLNELIFQLPQQIPFSEDPKQYAAATVAALNDYIERNGGKAVQRLFDDLSAVTHAISGEKIGTPLQRAIIDQLGQMWYQLREANNATYLPDNSTVRRSPEWKALEQLQATPTGQLLSSTLFAATDCVNRAQSHMAMRRVSNRTTDIETVHAHACEEWQAALFRHDPQRGSFLGYITNRLSLALANRVLRNEKEAVSLNETLGGKDGSSDTERGDLIEDPNAVDPSLASSSSDMTSNLEQAIEACLDAREQKIIRLRFGLKDGSKGMTLEEISTTEGVTRERIRQIEKEAMLKLRRHMEQLEDEDDVKRGFALQRIGEAPPTPPKEKLKPHLIHPAVKAAAQQLAAKSTPPAKVSTPEEASTPPAQPEIETARLVQEPVQAPPTEPATPEAPPAPPEAKPKLPAAATHVRRMERLSLVEPPAPEPIETLPPAQWMMTDDIRARMFERFLNIDDQVNGGPLGEKIVQRFQTLERWKERLNDLIIEDNINHKRWQKPEKCRPHVTTEMLQKWVKQQRIPAQYWELAAQTLNVQKDSVFMLEYHPQAQAQYLHTLLSGEEKTHHGAYADLFTFAAIMQHVSHTELACRLGLFTETVEEIARGNLVPSPRLEARISNILLEGIADALPEGGIEAARQTFATFAQQARKQQAQSVDEKTAHALAVMGDVDIDTTIGSIIARVTDKEGPGPLHRSGENFTAKDVYWYRNNTEKHVLTREGADEKMAGMAAAYMPSDVCRRIFTNVAFRRIPERSFSDLLRLYLQDAPKGQPQPERTAQGFLAYLRQEWRIGKHYLKERLGIPWETVESLGMPGQGAVIERIMESQHVTDPELKLEMYALMRAQDQYGKESAAPRAYVSLDALCDQAEEIIRCAQKGGTGAPDISADNAVYRTMLERGFTPAEGPLDISKLSCSLCEELTKRSGLSLLQIEHRGGHDSKGTLARIHSGEATVTTTASGDEIFPDALRMAHVFTEDPSKKLRLALLFQGIVNRHTPHEMLEKIRRGELTAGAAIHLYRKEHFLTRDDFIALQHKEGGSLSTATIKNVERNESQLGAKSSREEGLKQAGAIANALGFTPDTPDHEEYTGHLLNRHISKDAKKRILAMLNEAEANPEQRFSLQDFLEPIKEHLGARSDHELARMVQVGDRTISAPTIKDWQAGQAARNHKPIEALVKKVGLRGWRKDLLLDIARDRRLCYDPSIIENLTEETSAAQRREAIAALRNNARLGHVALGQKIREFTTCNGRDGIGNSYSSEQFEERGGQPLKTRMDDPRHPEFIHAFACAVVPATHLAHRDKLERILETKPLAVARNPEKSHTQDILDRRNATETGTDTSEGTAPPGF